MRESIKLLRLLFVFMIAGILFGLTFVSAATILAAVFGEQILAESILKETISVPNNMTEIPLILTSWKAILRTGLQFGFYMFIFSGIPLYFLNNRELRFAHKRQFEIPYAYDKAFSLCLSSLRLLQKHEIRRKNHKNGRIVGKVPYTWSRPANTLILKLRPVSEDRTRITLVNRGMPGLIGSDNIDKIELFLTSKRKIPSHELWRLPIVIHRYAAQPSQGLLE